MGHYREHAPAPHIGERVECFWISQFAEAAPHRVLPDGCADISIREQTECHGSSSSGR